MKNVDEKRRNFLIKKAFFSINKKSNDEKSKMEKRVLLPFFHHMLLVLTKCLLGVLIEKQVEKKVADVAKKEQTNKIRSLFF